MAKGLPVAGSGDAGPVDPKQLPSELIQITKKRRVSIGRDGPTTSSHQPGDGSSGEDVAWADGDMPVKMRMALSRAVFSSPQVS